MLSRLSIVQKLGISILAFLSCIAALIYFYAQSIGANIEFAQKEMQGDAYQRALMPLLFELGQLQQAHKTGQAVSDSRDKIDAAFGPLRQAQESLGESLQFTEQGLSSRGRSQLKLETVEGGWQKLKAGLDKPYDNDAEASYKSLIGDIRGMVAHAGDTSNLILDPDLDSYYLMDITLIALPQTIDRLGQIAISLSDKSALATDEKTEVAVQSRMVKEADFDRISADFDTSFKEDPNFNGVSDSYKASLEAPLATFNESYGALVASMNALAKDGHPGAMADVQTKLAAARAAADALWVVSAKELDVLLQKRIESYQAQKTAVLLQCGVGVFLSIIFFMIVARNITRPLADIQSVMQSMTGGDVRRPIPHTQRRDEIGRMAAATAIFQKGLLEREEMKAQQEAERIMAQQQKAQELMQLANTFESNVKHVVDVVAAAATQMDATSQTVGETVANSMKQLSQLAQNVESVSEKVQAVSSTTTQLSGAIHEISQQVAKSNSITHQAVEQSNVASTTVASLVGSAQDIGAVIEVINAITGQINLLALNATIEAARAGEAGKGFAVVASEVKNLASQTQKATEEIHNKVQAIQQTSAETATVIRQIAATINEINSISTAIAAAVEEQSVATKDISESIDHTSRETRSITESAASVTSAAGNTSGSAREMQAAATELSKQAERLRGEVDRFLGQVRAA